MAIQPTPSDHPSRLGRLAPRTPVEPSRVPGPAAGPSGADPSDRVEISSAAHELSGPAAVESVPVGAIAPARLREVLDRLGSGYYERADVRDALVQRVAREL